MADRYWVGNGSTDWHRDDLPDTNWGTASDTGDNASIPTSEDDVFFDEFSQAGDCTLQFDAVCKSLTISADWGTSSQTFDQNGSTITVSGNIDDQSAETVWNGTVIVDAASTITLNTTAFDDFVFNAAATFTISGTVSVNNLTITLATTINGGTIQASGNVILTDATVTGTCDIDMIGTGTLSGAGTAPSGGDFRFNGAVTFTVSGTVTVNRCEILLATTINGGIVQCGSDLTLTDTTVTGTCDFVMTGTGTISGAGDIPASGDLTINSSGTVTLANAIAPPVNCTITTGILDLAGFDLTVGGNLVITDTLQLEGDETVAVTGSITNTAGTVIFTNVAATAILGVIEPYFNITMLKGKTYQGANGTTVTCTGTVSFSGSGTLTIQSNLADNDFNFALSADQAWDTDLAVKDCNASNVAQTAIGATNNGGNTNWTFNLSTSSPAATFVGGL